MMTAHAVPRPKARRKAGGFLVLPFVCLIVSFAVLIAGVGGFVAYLLWPTWPHAPIPADAPAIPVTVAGVLFNVPTAAIRAKVQRYPGAHERVDLALLWPSLVPPQPDAKADTPPTKPEHDAAQALAPVANDRLFVTITALGTVLAPAERMRSIYPRYVDAQAVAGPEGLAILPFRAGTPYQGEDLVYRAEEPERFFARCSRPARSLPGTCIHERSLDAAEITLRFPRAWLVDWRGLAEGLDRLMAQLHPPG